MRRAYARALFSFTTEEDIDTNKLAQQWNVKAQGVVGMISAAKKSERLYNDLRATGFEDDARAQASGCAIHMRAH